MVKRCLTRGKRQWTGDIANKVENATNLGSMKGVYDATRKLCNGRPRNVTMVKDKEGKLLTKDNDIRKRWSNHSAEVLDRLVPHETPTIEEIEIGYITKEEIRKAVRDIKSGKAAGMDSITVEMLKVDVVTTTDVSHELFQIVWDQQKIPEDWSKGLIVKLPKKGDLTVCGNWKGITLMSTAAMVMVGRSVREFEMVSDIS